ncbi:MAG: hypothetical protein E7180_06650 [Erysipelotrichaceae bacterium]|nr:hypothetical protein [Erysipelotrichaceae bacterium]
MNKFYLSCTVQYADPIEGLSTLYTKDLPNISLEEAEALYSEFNGTEATGEEYLPNSKQIKYSVSIFATDYEEDLVFVKEKYKLFSLRDIHPTFWSLYKKVQLLREE